MTITSVEMRSVVFTIPGLRAVNPTNGSHGHWSTNHKRVKQARLLTWRSAILAGLESLRAGETAKVLLARVGPKELDNDNLRPSLKGVRDEIARRLGLDDADPRIEWLYAQRRRGREYAVDVEITMEVRRG